MKALVEEFETVVDGADGGNDVVADAAAQKRRQFGCRQSEYVRHLSSCLPVKTPASVPPKRRAKRITGAPLIIASGAANRIPSVRR